MYHVSLLPRYTTERYWVLSEIEQRISKFISIDNLVPESDENTIRNAVVSIYLLWNTEVESIESLRQRIEKLITELTTFGYIKDGCHVYVAIEVLLVRSKWAAHQESMDDLIQHLLQKSAVGHVVCGISDDSASACGLEALLKYYTTIYTLNPILNGNINCFIAAESNDHFLGHDITRDPDAKDNVLQFLYSSLSNEDYIPWIRSHILTRYKDIQVKRKQLSSDHTSNYWFYMGLLLMFIGCFVVPFVFKLYVSS